MGQQTKIEWCDATWNPVTGCTPISEGCQNCWAQAMANRFHRSFAPTFHSIRLDHPFRWRKPRRIAVSLTGDLFHKDVPNEWIDEVFTNMLLSPQHTFMVLTKRPDRMCDYLTNANLYGRIIAKANCRRSWSPKLCEIGISDPTEFPAKWIWLGTSVENQQAADERLPWLLKCPAVVRFLSMEPLLSEINLGPWLAELEPKSKTWLRKFYGPAGFDPTGSQDATPFYKINNRGIHWVIVGGESGPHARPCHPDWVRLVRDQCQAAKVPFFFKQWGEWMPSSHIPGGSHDVWKQHQFNNGEITCRVGKSVAGRLLDGREWNETPEVPKCH